MSKKPKVCLALPIEDDLRAKLDEACDVVEIDYFAPRAKMLEAIKEVEGVLGTSRVNPDSEYFELAPNLRVFSSYGVGYDAIDIEAATRRGVVVCNTPGVLTNAVANLTVSMVFVLTRKLIENESYVRSGGWARREEAPALGMDIEGKTFGVIGFGRIGQEVTGRVQALGMRTLWHDVFEDPPEGAPASEYRSFDALLSESDFVSLHTNLSSSSHHMIGTNQLNLMKPTAYLINTARGPLVDQAALTKALKSGTIAGAGLDVFETEPTDENEPIVQLPNAYCFPHVGSATEETRRAMRELALQNLLDVLSGRRPQAPVNPAVLE